MKINLNVTRFYRTRSGCKAVVIWKYVFLPDHFEYCGYICSDAVRGSAWMWSSDGRARVEGRGTDPLDIVSYWKESKPIEIDWSKYPDYVRYISRDEDGDVFWHTDAPEKRPGHYCVNSDEHPFRVTRLFPEGLEPDMGDCSWEDSLVERPRVSFSIFIPWDKIPKEYSVVAWDSFGGWVAYKYIPRPLTCGEFSRAARNVLQDDNLAWCCLSRLGTSLPDPHCWKESLFIRPGTDPIKDFDSDE